MHKRLLVRLKKYGITEARLVALELHQGLNCAICEGPFTGINDYHIDHSHKTGQVRGLLCRQCNMGLGLFGDEEKLLLRAADYISNPPMQQLLFLKQCAGLTDIPINN